MGELKAMKVLLKAGAAMAVMTAAVPALAQETQLETIVIEGQGSPSAVAPVRGYVAKTSSAGSKGNTPLSEIPQSVSVIGQQEIQDRGITNKVDELLRYTPGVVAQPYGSDPDTDWYFIRGFNATQTGVYFDDLNLFSYGFGGFQIDPFMLERVDVLKGPASVLYGGANAGGIVNMIRKRPTDDPLYLTETGLNSNGNAFFGFDVSDAFAMPAGSTRCIRATASCPMSGRWWTHPSGASTARPSSASRISTRADTTSR